MPRLLVAVLVWPLLVHAQCSARSEPECDGECSWSGGQCGQTCFRPITGYTPDMFGQAVLKLGSREQCKQRCQDTPGCIHFTFYENGNCHLHDETAGRQEVTTAVSGEPDCEEPSLLGANPAAFPADAWTGSASGVGIAAGTVAPTANPAAFPADAGTGAASGAGSAAGIAAPTSFAGDAGSAAGSVERAAGVDNVAFTTAAPAVPAATTPPLSSLGPVDSVSVLVPAAPAPLLTSAGPADLATGDLGVVNAGGLFDAPQESMPADVGKVMMDGAVASQSSFSGLSLRSGGPLAATVHGRGNVAAGSGAVLLVALATVGLRRRAGDGAIAQAAAE